MLDRGQRALRAIVWQGVVTNLSPFVCPRTFLLPTMVPVTAELAPPPGNEWIGLCPQELDPSAAHEWLVRPDCGAVVVFTGNVRDHAGERSGVELLTYEAWETEAGARLEAVAAELRRRWPEAGRVALLHRTGDVALSRPAVVVGVSAPHRAAAFEAARFGIDAVKAAVPIWKRERWAGGEDWGLDGAELVDPAQVVSATGRAV